MKAEAFVVSTPCGTLRRAKARIVLFVRVADLFKFWLGKVLCVSLSLTTCTFTLAEPLAHRMWSCFHVQYSLPIRVRVIRVFVLIRAGVWGPHWAS
jgi:hypothetical protein